MKQCTVCGKDITVQNQYSESKTYINNLNKDSKHLWTTVKINGKIEGLTYSEPINPLCINCSITILKNTIKKLKEVEKWK